MRVLEKVFQEFSLESSSTRYNSRQVPRLDKWAALLCSSCKRGLSLPDNHSGKSVDMPTSPSSETSCVTLVKALHPPFCDAPKKKGVLSDNVDSISILQQTMFAVSGTLLSRV